MRLLYQLSRHFASVAMSLRASRSFDAIRVVVTP